MRVWIVVSLTAALAGCATTEPQGPPTPSLQEVRANPAAFAGETVRWGGIIAGVENRAEETCVAVVGRELERSGRPSEGDQSDGRFLACLTGFLDPMVYREGREFTVSGVVAGSESRRIGDFPYTYPVVRVQRHQLWEPRPVYVEPADPFWYDPWPYWGPYWGPGYYHHPRYYYPSNSGAPKRWRAPRRD